MARADVTVAACCNSSLVRDGAKIQTFETSKLTRRSQTDLLVVYILQNFKRSFTFKSDAALANPLCRTARSCFVYVGTLDRDKGNVIFQKTSEYRAYI